MKLSPVILILMVSDVIMWTGTGLYEPILAIFINDQIRGGSVFTAGIATAIFLFTKSIIQLPFSRHVDRHDDRNDTTWLIIGSVFIVLGPVIYIFATSIWTVFLAQLSLGIGGGLAYPTWLGLWSTHLDKGHESFEWTLYSTLVGIGTAITAAGGAAIAEYFGFRITFAIVAALSFVGAAMLLALFKTKLNGHPPIPVQIKGRKKL